MNVDTFRNPLIGFDSNLGISIEYDLLGMSVNIAVGASYNETSTVVYSSHNNLGTVGSVYS